VKDENTPLIVPVFLPHAGCPHQCVFCNQQAVTGTSKTIPNPAAIQRAMEIYADSQTSNIRPIQIAFYGGNFLGLPTRTVRFFLDTATRFVQAGRINSIRFSTRPDTVDDHRLQFIADYPVSTVEIGAQSMSDRVLNRSRRGHRAADTVNAVRLLKTAGLEVGVQMMVGLPGDDDQTVLASGREIAALGPAFVRIYPTLVLPDSPLGRWYSEGRYHPLDLDRAVKLTKRLLVLFHNHRIPVIRMGLQASAELDDGSSVVAGPYHPAFGHLVYEALFFDVVKSRFLIQPPGGTARIIVHPRNESKLRGLNNHNMRRLADQFHLRRLAVETDVACAVDTIVVNGHSCRLYGNRSDTATTDAGVPCD
jgi:histone acetyltransferase (RNA polymerase elongator complex component)